MLHSHSHSCPHPPPPLPRSYHLDDASLARIFASTDLDGSQSLNVHEFLATLAILHILKVGWMWAGVGCAHAFWAGLRVLSRWVVAWRWVGGRAGVACVWGAAGPEAMCVHRRHATSTAHVRPCILVPRYHSLQGPEDEERVEPCILATWRTAEDAFLSCASSAQGRLDRDELLAMMHEVGAGCK